MFNGFGRVIRRMLCGPAALALLGCAMVPQQSGPLTAQPGDLRVLNMHRLTEAQYRNAISDIFGADVSVSGRFEPIIRPDHQLIAVGAAAASISPTGFEQFDAIARGVAAQVLDEERRGQFLTCTPKSETAADEACARRFLTEVGRYVFRRPLTEEEARSYVALASAGASKSANFHTGLQLSLAAMLVSPNFLFISDTARTEQGAGAWELDGYGKASRLSFLLWNTTPDDELLSAAAKGELDTEVGLKRQVDRLISSPRLEQGVRAFFSDMLMFEKFDELAKDPLIYRKFNNKAAADMPEQLLKTIVDHSLTRDGDYRDLFTTRRTFMTRPLGVIYETPVTVESGWQPYEFAADSDRAGILGQAGFLALYAHSGRSSPTLRGRAIRELLMCQPVPLPPPDVDFTIAQDTDNPILKTARARLDAHAIDPTCAGCHRITDPIGLPLERFDGIGAFRARENGEEIDASGEFENVTFSSAAGLGQALRKSPAVTACVVSRAYEYARGEAAAADQIVLTNGLHDVFAQGGYRIRDLFRTIASHPETYRMRASSEPVQPIRVAFKATPRQMEIFHARVEP